MDKIEIINRYVVDNEKKLKNTCFKIARGHQDWEDLFIEFYLRVVETKPEKFARYSIGQLCYWTIVEVWQNKRGGLKRFEWKELDNVNVSIQPNEHFDLMDFIEEKIDSKDFKNVMAFVECTDTSLRNVQRKTGINEAQLSRFRAKGIKQLKAFLGESYMLTQ